MTSYDGSSLGTVFGLNMDLGRFISFFVPAAKVGSTGGILGQGFIGTTSVSINGTPASFNVVPPGATTGYVTVTTPTGVLTSNVPFQVIP